MIFFLHFFDLWPPFFERKGYVLKKTHSGKLFRNRSFNFKICFGQFWNDSKIFGVSFLFRPKMVKTWGFFADLRPKFFLQRRFCTLRWFFYCLFEPSYNCVPLTIAALFPSEQIHTTPCPASILYIELMSMVWRDNKNRHRRYSLVRSFGSRG